MSEKGQEIYALSQYLIDEIINAAGLKKSVWTHRFLDFLLRNVTTHLATICVITDQKIASDGFPAATGWPSRRTATISYSKCAPAPC